jgi:chloramphenicol 3-O phosphotransferase
VGVEPGTIVLLNGTASSGKTSICRALQELMPEPWLYAGIDKFLSLLPARYLEWPLWSDVMGQFDRPGDVGSVLISGMHDAIAALARRGNSVVADHVIVDPAWVSECAGLFRDLPAWFVGVKVPLDVVLRRERDRGDRDVGEAEKQFSLVHAAAAYDFEVDTSVLSAYEAAESIRSHLVGRPRAFMLLALFEGAPEFVRRLLATNRDDPLAGAEQIALAMAETHQIELLNAHPRIGAASSSVSDLSFREQGYDRDPGTAELQARLHRLNDEYEQRFGFRFVVFVAGRPRTAIADLMEAHLAANRNEEKERGLREVIAIARDRAARPR